MTFEEMQQIIKQMLGVQRELQEGQIKLAERQEVFMTELQQLAEISKEGNVKIDRLIGYAINRERDLIDVQEDILNLKRRLSRLEERLEQQ